MQSSKGEYTFCFAFKPYRPSHYLLINNLLTLKNNSQINSTSQIHYVDNLIITVNLMLWIDVYIRFAV